MGNINTETFLNIMNSIELSIIIVNWNTKKFVDDCLESIYHYPPKCTFEIIVIDNASSDGSCEIIKRRFPFVQLVENQVNVGFATANNQAISYSKGEFVMLLNPDTVIRDESLNNLYTVIKQDKFIGAVGGKLLNPDGTMQSSCCSYPTIRVVIGWFISQHPPLNFLGKYIWNEFNYDIVQEVDAPVGAAIILRKQAIKDIGLFDTAFFLYAEEIDLCYRLKQAGWKVMFIPNSNIIHYGGKSSKQVSEKALVEWMRSHRYFYEKHYSLFKKIMLDLFLITEIIWGVVTNFIFNQEEHISAVFIYMRVFKNVYFNPIRYEYKDAKIKRSSLDL